MKNILEAPFIIEMCETTANMYRLGWDERNGGNISWLLKEEQLTPYLDVNNVVRTIPLGFDAKPLVGCYFLVTGTGKFFKNVTKRPEESLGIFRIGNDGLKAELLWGYSDGGKFTSELPSHLMTHIERIKIDPNHSIVMHCHPTNIVAMTHIHPLSERDFSRTLWKMETECIVVFPEGIGILPWMLCGTNAIGLATANKMKDYRMVVWSQHGIYGVGTNMDETFGLIETAEKAAELYVKIMHMPIVNEITDDELKLLAKAFNVKPRMDFLDN